MSSYIEVNGTYANENEHLLDNCVDALLEAVLTLNHKRVLKDSVLAEKEHHGLARNILYDASGAVLIGGGLGYFIS